MNYFVWFDDSTKKETVVKIDEAMARYEQKYGTKPTVCLVQAGEQVTHISIVVKAAQHVRRGYFYIGIEEREQLPTGMVVATSDDEELSSNSAAGIEE